MYFSAIERWKPGFLSRHKVEQAGRLWHPVHNEVFNKQVLSSAEDENRRISLLYLMQFN